VFRVDRDNYIDAFKKQTRGFGQSVIDGKMSADEFIEAMQSSIENHYKSLYRQGKGITELSEWEEELILKQAQTQKQYLHNFGDYIRQKQALGKDLTPYVTARAELYGERGKAIFEAGSVASMPNDALLTWKMQPAEHCSTCPVYASNSPYTKETLPGFPGEGFHLTQCGVRCHCMVVLSDLYVTQKDLGLDVGRGFVPIPETPINVMDLLKPISVPKPVLTPNEMAEKARTNLIRESEAINKRIDDLAKEADSIVDQMSNTWQRYLDTNDSTYADLYTKQEKQAMAVLARIDRFRLREKDIGARHLIVNKEPVELRHDFKSGTKNFKDKKYKDIQEISRYINPEITKDLKVFIDEIKGRACYSSRLRTISLQAKDMTGVTFHEYGHFIEDANAEIRKDVKAFLSDRTKEDKSERLRDIYKNQAYSIKEVSKKDKFIDAYIGKQYSDGSTEVLSMGMQYMIEMPVDFAKKDAEMFDLIYKAMRGLIK
jgi:hypothetical protein